MIIETVWNFHFSSDDGLWSFTYWSRFEESVCKLEPKSWCVFWIGVFKMAAVWDKSWSIGGRSAKSWSPLRSSILSSTPTARNTL